MTAAALKRKGISVDLDVHGAIDDRRSKKKLELGKKGDHREVTFSEILRDLLPELNRK
jgi:hypothetical protein